MASYQLLQEQVYHELKNRILSGALQPGIIYSETKTAAELGVSKTPVKSAILRLSQENFVRIIPSRGYQLRGITVEDIWESYRVRTAIESFSAVQLMLRRHTPEGKIAINELEQLLEDLQRLIAIWSDDEDNQELMLMLLEENVKFHQAIIESSGSSKFIELFQGYSHSVLKTTAENQRISYRSFSKLNEIYSEHKQIVDSIRNGDELGCYHAIEAHMRIARDESLALHQE